MKKILWAVAFMVGVMFASCNKTKSVESTDSTAVDTVMVDSVAVVDTLVVDSVVVDSIL